ncbi:MAG: hypothetical protein H6Q28_1826, partial [Bacteroidetes bacterium]|nr:hypothetical protein [Bacteroidota bacterium]
MKRFVTGFLVFAMSVSCVAAAPGGARKLMLSAEDLFNGARGERVVLSGDRHSVTLDVRNAGSAFEGVIETDPLDLYDPANAGISIGEPALLYSVKVESRAPIGAAVELSYRTGNSFFGDRGWSEWIKVPGLETTIDRPKARYLRLRMSLRAVERERLPAVTRVSVAAQFEESRAYHRELNLVRFDNERIIRSALGFGWERPDSPAIRRFMESSGYAEEFNRGRTDFVRMTLLNRAGAATSHDRASMWDSDYPWDLSQLFFVKDGRKTIEGHCLSYAITLVSAMTGLNQYARHWAV